MYKINAHFLITRQSSGLIAADLVVILVNLGSSDPLHFFLLIYSLFYIFFHLGLITEYPRNRFFDVITFKNIKITMIRLMEMIHYDMMG